MSSGVPKQADRGPGIPSAPDLYVVVSGSHYHGVRRSGRGIADALADTTPVLFVDPPSSVVTASGSLGEGTAAGGSVTRESDQLMRLSPSAPPGKDRQGIIRVTCSWMAYQIRRAIRSLGATTVVLVQQSAHRSVIGRIDESVSVYHATDDLASGSALLGLDATSLDKAQASAASNADIVMAVSQALADRWSPLARRTLYLPNGVDADAFASDTPPSVEVEVDRPCAGLVGTLSERIDVSLLTGVADRMSLLLVGPESFRTDRSEFSELLRHPNTQWLGARGFDELAGIYRHVDVGLLPYTRSDFNRASFPLKSLEYLAAGKPVVSTDLPAVRSLDAPGIAFADTKEAFAEAAWDLATSNRYDPSGLRTFAASHSWRSRADLVMTAVQGILDERA